VEQIAFADIILLNKTDLVTEHSLKALEARVRTINPTARIIRTERSSVDPTVVLDQRAFQLDRILEQDEHFLHDHGHDHHHHDHGHDHHHDHSHDHGSSAENHIAAANISSVSIQTDKLINPQKLLPWLDRLTQEQGPDLLRMKGVLAFPDEPKRFVVQSVHMIMEGDVQRYWREDEPRVSRIVFIGRNLNADALRAGFLACAA
jgi:G3E family GTPase